jgi:MscS family membrane protein
MKKAIYLLLFCVVLTLPIASHGQFFQNTAADTTTKQKTTNDLDSLGRTTPRGTVNGLFKAILAQNYTRAARYIELPIGLANESDSVKKLMIKKIELTLNKKGRLSPARLISNDPKGNLEDDLSPSLEEVGSLDLSGVKTPILLKSSIVDADLTIWLLSATTTQEIINYIDANSAAYADEKIIQKVSESSGKAIMTIEWLAMIGLALGSYVVAWLVTLLLKFITLLIWKNYRESAYGRFLNALLIPLRLVFAVIILLTVSRLLEVSIAIRQAFSVVNIIALWAALFVFLWLLINALSSFGEQKLKDTNKFGGLSIISFFQNVAKFSLVIIAILIVFDTLGYNVTAGIAALGVGGLALALGAQKTVENLVGGLSIIFDQPVNVGDFCKFGDTIGTVEKIGVRSTRIRTLNRTLVSIPNADFSTRSIENYAPRDMFLFRTVLGLRYETSSDQMRYILVELRKILYAHPKVDRDPARVRFLGYGSDSLQVEIFAYTYAVDWNDFLGIQEDINLRIAQVIEASGSGFAFPSQTLYLTKDKGLSQANKEEAEKQVKQWIENNELNIPDFTEDEISGLKDSLNYPPEGSSKHTNSK